MGIHECTCTAVYPYILFLYTRVVYGTWYCTSTHDIKTLLCTHVQIHRWHVHVSNLQKCKIFTRWYFRYPQQFPTIQQRSFKCKG